MGPPGAVAIAISSTVLFIRSLSHHNSAPHYILCVCGVGGGSKCIATDCCRWAVGGGLKVRKSEGCDKDERIEEKG